MAGRYFAVTGLRAASDASLKLSAESRAAILVAFFMFGIRNSSDAQMVMHRI